MNSATSIERRLPVDAESPKADAAAQRVRPAQDAGLRPWHFFVLASLVMATIAVVLSRQSTPEHLVLISLTIIAAGLAGVGCHRMLAPLAAPHPAVFGEPLSESARAALAREKALVLRSIKELEFDRAMGKLSQKDFDEMSLRLRTRAIALMNQLDQRESGYREVIERELQARLSGSKSGAAKSAQATRRAAAADPRPRVRRACGACSTPNDDDAAFCKRCGAKL